MGYRRAMAVFFCSIILLMATMAAGWGMPQAALTVCALSALLATFRWWVRFRMGESSVASGLVRTFYVAILMAAGIPLLLKWIEQPDLVDPIAVAALAALAVALLWVISWWLERK